MKPMRYVYGALVVLIGINWWLGDEPLNPGLSAAECAVGCYILPIGE